MRNKGSAVKDNTGIESSDKTNSLLILRYFKLFSGNWVRYKDEKSFLLINKLVDYNSAENICKNLDQSIDSKVTLMLAVIESKDEQNFINRYLFEELGTVENVWIGVSKEELKTGFTINNGTYAKYTNWANGRPSDFLERNCVDIKSPFSKVHDKTQENLNGLWEDVSCDKNNLVLCQKMQTWTLSQVQRLFYEMNNKLNNLIENPGIHQIR
jgi:hypothetical protein